MREFQFKRDPHADLEYWAIKNGQLAKRGGSKALKLREVDRAVWTDLTQRQLRIYQLEVATATQSVTLTCHDPGGTENLDVFLALCLIVSLEVDEDVPVKLETRPLERLLFWRKPQLIMGREFAHLLRGMTAPVGRPEDDT